MATYKPELHSIESVMSYFDQYDDSAYQVFAGHKPEAAYCRFTYTGNDKGIGREKLLEALQSVVSNPDNTNTYLLQILTSKGKKMEPINSITFQLNKPNQYYPVANNHNSNNDLIIAKLNAIEQRINLIEEDEEEEEEEENNDLGALGNLINNPQLQTLLMQGIMNIFNNKKPQMSAVAGIPEDQNEKIKVALEVLQKNVPDLGDKLLKLADMSVNESVKFQMLIKML
jgi:hypothetical protein